MPKKTESVSGKKVAETKSKRVSAKKTGTVKKTPASEPAAAGTRVKKERAAGTVRAKTKKAAGTVEKIGHGMDLVRRCLVALEEKKARDIEVTRVGETSSVTDYYVLATGTSDPHLRSIRIELEKAIDAVVPEGSVRIQNEAGSGWCVVDAFDVVVHVFAAEQRARYNLEELYASGEKIDL